MSSIISTKGLARIGIYRPHRLFDISTLPRTWGICTGRMEEVEGHLLRTVAAASDNSVPNAVMSTRKGIR